MYDYTFIFKLYDGDGDKAGKLIAYVHNHGTVILEDKEDVACKNITFRDSILNQICIKENFNTNQITAMRIDTYGQRLLSGSIQFETETIIVKLTTDKQKRSEKTSYYSFNYRSHDKKINVTSIPCGSTENLDRVRAVGISKKTVQQEFIPEKVDQAITPSGVFQPTVPGKYFLDRTSEKELLLPGELKCIIVASQTNYLNAFMTIMDRIEEVRNQIKLVKQGSVSLCSVLTMFYNRTCDINEPHLKYNDMTMYIRFTLFEVYGNLGEKSKGIFQIVYNDDGKSNDDDVGNIVLEIKKTDKKDLQELIKEFINRLYSTEESQIVLPPKYLFINYEVLLNQDNLINLTITISTYLEHKYNLDSIIVKNKDKYETYVIEHINTDFYYTHYDYSKNYNRAPCYTKYFHVKDSTAKSYILLYKKQL